MHPEVLRLTFHHALSELTGSPFAPTDAIDAAAHAALREVESVLGAVDLGVDPGVRAAPWPELRDRVVHPNTVLRPEAAYAARGRVVPDCRRSSTPLTCSTPVTAVTCWWA